MPVSERGLTSVIKILDPEDSFYTHFPLRERDFSLSLVLIQEVKSPVFITDQDSGNRN